MPSTKIKNLWHFVLFCQLGNHMYRNRIWCIAPLILHLIFYQWPSFQIAIVKRSSAFFLLILMHNSKVRAKFCLCTPRSYVNKCRCSSVIHYLVTRWPVYPQGISCTHLEGGWVCSRDGLESLDERKLLFLSVIKPWLVGCTARDVYSSSVYTIPAL